MNVCLTLAVAQAEGEFSINVFEEILASRGVVLAVLVILVLMSLASWLIVMLKGLQLARVRRQSARFMKQFWESPDLDRLEGEASHLKASPLARLFAAGQAELAKLRSSGNGKKIDGDTLENVERALRRTANGEVSRLERLVPFLATTGSTAPFIGLFGTVWGIMKAFAYIDPQRSLLATVTPHIAQALVATAIGLLAAIPAVMAYNYFVARIKRNVTDMDNFAADLINLLRRQHL